MKRKSSFKKSMYGVFGYIKLKKHSYLIMIEEAQIVGQIIRGTVYRVSKLLFIPVIAGSDMSIDSQDKPFIEMIQNI